MPLIILGVIVVIIAVAIFKVNNWQAERYVKLAQKAKEAKEADDADDVDDADVND
ncbi:MAG: hypothetical protein Q4C25_04355 [Bacillota bacterium]|nr:hypothetical protein [Bacillota bacterium]